MPDTLTTVYEAGRVKELLWVRRRTKNPIKLNSIDYIGQQSFPTRKNVCFWCTFGRWIQICFQNFFITHTFRVSSDYVKAQAYTCEPLGACRR